MATRLYSIKTKHRSYGEMHCKLISAHAHSDPLVTCGVCSCVYGRSAWTKRTVNNTCSPHHEILNSTPLCRINFSWVLKTLINR